MKIEKEKEKEMMLEELEAEFKRYGTTSTFKVEN